MIADLVERVTLRRTSASFAFADVRLPGVNLHGLRVEATESGRLSIRPPEQRDRHGRCWPIYVLQPGTLEAVEARVAALWAQSGGMR